MKRPLLIITLLMLTLLAKAGDVTSRDARKKAAGLMPGKGDMQLAAQAPGEQPAYYVFNTQQKDGGFVIIAGDDRAGEAIAYARQGSFDPENIPDGMQYMLDCYEEQIELIRAGNATPHRSPATHPAIAPLIATHWNQGKPYNTYCPTDCPTGCVATAMAQIMKYWSLPIPTTAIPAYSSFSALSERTFDYAIMQNRYSSADDTGADEVAWLMKYCGQSVEMSYASGGSSASISSLPFTDYFGYDSDAHIVQRAAFTTDGWDEVIYGELSADRPRPVIYSGKSPSSGHAFIIDGYDGDGLYHINWGWGGQSDGFFKLSLCNPSDLGTGGGSSKAGYSMNQKALIGLQEEDGEADMDYVRLTLEKMYTYGTTFTRSNASSDFSFTVNFGVRNNLSQTYKFDYAFGLYQGETLVKVLNGGSTNLGPSYGTPANNPWTRSVSFGSGLDDGDYTLRAISRVSGESEWKEDHGSRVYQIMMTISGNTLSVTPNGESFVVNSCEVPDHLVTQKPVEFTLSVTNTGTTNTGSLAIIIDNSIVGAQGFAIDPGTTDEVKVKYTPTTAGEYTAKIALAEKNSSSWTVKMYLTEKTFTVEERREPNLSFTRPQVENSGSSQIIGSTFKGSFKVTNNDSEPFNDEILIKLYKQEPEAEYGYLERTLTEEVTIAPGETMTIPFEFNYLETGKRYWARPYFFKPSSNAYASPISSYAYTLIEDPTGIYAPERTTDEDGATWHNLQGIRIEKPTKAGIYVKNGRKVVIK